MLVSLLNENIQFKFESETKCCSDGLGVLITKKSRRAGLFDVKSQ